MKNEKLLLGALSVIMCLVPEVRGMNPTINDVNEQGIDKRKHMIDANTLPSPPLNTPKNSSSSSSSSSSSNQAMPMPPPPPSSAYSFSPESLSGKNSSTPPPPPPPPPSTSANHSNAAYIHNMSGSLATSTPQANFDSSSSSSSSSSNTTLTTLSELLTDTTLISKVTTHINEYMKYALDRKSEDPDCDRDLAEDLVNLWKNCANGDEMQQLWVACLPEEYKQEGNGEKLSINTGISAVSRYPELLETTPFTVGKMKLAECALEGLSANTSIRIADSDRGLWSKRYWYCIDQGWMGTPSWKMWSGMLSKTDIGRLTLTYTKQIKRLNALLKNPENWTKKSGTMFGTFDCEKLVEEELDGMYTPDQITTTKQKIGTDLEVANNILELLGNCEDWDSIKDVWSATTGTPALEKALEVIANNLDCLIETEHARTLDLLLNQIWIHGQVDEKGVWTIQNLKAKALRKDLGLRRTHQNNISCYQLEMKKTEKKVSEQRQKQEEKNEQEQSRKTETIRADLKENSTIQRQGYHPNLQTLATLMDQLSSISIIGGLSRKTLRLETATYSRLRDTCVKFVQTLDKALGLQLADTLTTVEYMSLTEEKNSGDMGQDDEEENDTVMNISREGFERVLDDYKSKVTECCANMNIYELHRTLNEIKEFFCGVTEENINSSTYSDRIQTLIDKVRELENSMSRGNAISSELNEKEAELRRSLPEKEDIPGKDRKTKNKRNMTRQPTQKLSPFEKQLRELISFLREEYRKLETEPDYTKKDQIINAVDEFKKSVQYSKSDTKPIPEVLYIPTAITSMMLPGCKNQNIINKILETTWLHVRNNLEFDRETWTYKEKETSRSSSSSSSSSSSAESDTDTDKSDDTDAD